MEFTGHSQETHRRWQRLSAGAIVLNGEGLMCHETPDADTIAKCKEIGQKLALL